MTVRAASVAVGVAACFSPSPPIGQPCAPGDRCPIGQACELGACVTIDAAVTGPDAGCTPVSSGLLGHWPMDTNDVTGFTVRDRSGNGLDGRVIGLVPLTTRSGRIGEALDFTMALGAHVEIPMVPFDSAAGSATTVSMWYRRDVTMAAVDDALIYIPASPRYDLWLTESAGEVHLCVNTGNGECWGVADAGLVDRWVHVAAIFRNGPTIDSELYVDGAAVAPSCAFGACTVARTVASPVTLGGNDSYDWRGLVDDVRIHGRALAASEIAALHAGTACPP